MGKVFAAAGAVLIATASCGDVVRQGRSPVMLVINTLQAASGGGHAAGVYGSPLLSDVQVLLPTPAPQCAPPNPMCPYIFNDPGQATLSLALKDIGSAAPTAVTTNNQVTIDRVHVEYVRADGRNVPGVDVPYPFDGAVTGTVVGTGTTQIAFQMVRHAAKEEGPLVQLISSGTFITTIARVTFYGKDAVGNDISATGQLEIDFGNYGDQ